MQNSIPLISPKQPPTGRERDWYPYYAGFTEEFAEAVLAEYLGDCTLILDPWSGSGTTSAVCARLGIRSVGVDINPALTVVARARLTQNPGNDDLLRCGRRILEDSHDLKDKADDQDPLRRWIKGETVDWIRAIQRSIHASVGQGLQLPGVRDIETVVKELPDLACFFYTALFATTRNLLRQFRGSNPMWHKDPESNRDRIAVSWDHVQGDYLQRVQYLQDRLRLDRESSDSRYATLCTANATRLPFPADCFDGVLTSPPYATRIDYVVGSLPELAVLGLDDDLISSLRAATTGTPVISSDSELLSDRLIVSEYARQLLREIGGHPSKGSRPITCHGCSSIC